MISRRNRAVTFSAAQSKKINSTLSTFQNKLPKQEESVLLEVPGRWRAAHHRCAVPGGGTARGYQVLYWQVLDINGVY